MFGSHHPRAPRRAAFAAVLLAALQASHAGPANAAAESAAATNAEAGSPLQVDAAWIRAAPPGAAALAAYARLRNPGDGALTVTPCATDGYARVSLHETVHADGMARMRPLPALRLAPRGSVELAPGGMHLMLERPAVQPVAGAAVRVCLAIDGTQEWHEFVVRATAPGEGERHRHGEWDEQGHEHAHGH